MQEETPPRTIGDFLRRHAPALSIQERKGLERSVNTAVSAYLKDMHEKAEMDRERRRLMVVDAMRSVPEATALEPHSESSTVWKQPQVPASRVIQAGPPRETTATSLTWRSETPFCVKDSELKQFRHSQNPRKPPPEEPPHHKHCRPATALGIRSSPDPGFEEEQFEPLTVRSVHPSPRPPSGAKPSLRHQIRRPAKASITHLNRPKSAIGFYSSPRVQFAMEQNDHNGVKEEYVPCLKAWIDGASDYERNVVYNVMKVLKKGKRDGLEGVAASEDMVVPQPYSAYRIPPRPDQYTFGRRTRPTTPLEVYVPATIPTDSRQYFGGIDDDFRREQKARIALNKDYIHESSCFNNSMPAYRSSFVIHPDWVSESKVNKTLMTKTSSNGLRYGASRRS